jgi:hypothetical protein
MYALRERFMNEPFDWTMSEIVCPFHACLPDLTLMIYCGPLVVLDLLILGPIARRRT